MKTRDFMIGIAVAAAILVAGIAVTAFVPARQTAAYADQDFAPDTDELIRRKELCIALVGSDIKVSIAQRKSKDHGKRK